MIDATLEDVDAADDHPRLPDVRHLLAYRFSSPSRIIRRRKNASS
nr:hypothetical protein OG781_27025 [Streptomyces sp. NBC_00830]